MVVNMFIQRQTAGKPRELAYQDDELLVEVGVNARDDGAQTDNRRNYSNCIKITTTSTNTHFIQFVTRQVPDIYEYNKSGRLEWDEVRAGSHFMTDNNPKWKVDTTEDALSCFYEDQGVCKRGDNFLSIYDYPGGAAEVAEERAIFCTFVITNHQVTHVIKWSKEFNSDDYEFYTVDTQLSAQKKLPYWTSDKLQQFYSEIKQPIPQDLRACLPSKELVTPSDLMRESRQYFLKPSPLWVTSTIKKYEPLLDNHAQRRASLLSFK